jgi:hypothetical protein
MDGQFLEQWVNIKFSMKLGKNTSDTCTVPFEAYGEGTVKKSSVF